LKLPQFELILCFLAIQSAQTKKRRKSSSGPITLMAFAKKTNNEFSLSRIIHDFFKDIKIEKPSNFVGASRRQRSMSEKIEIKVSSLDEVSMYSDEEVLPQSSYPGMRCLDQYTSSLKHDRQAMLFKMQHLFTEVESLLLADPTSNGGSLIKIITLNRNAEKSYSSSQRFASKPVVISDAIPLPSGQCSPLVEQLLQSALAHHNLGSYQEALDFLDGAKGQFKEPKSTSTNTDHVQEVQNRRMSLNQVNLGELPFEIEMYITLSKGNLYRSRDEDELAMACYMGGWKRAQKIGNKEWGVIFVNSIGVLAYYSIRYDIALMCFDTVVHFREEEYGSESSDTATALNNEGCCLFCMHERGEARLRFERCWLAGNLKF
jgi:tetratricopeptide (TPR) repeat protein